MNPFPHQVDAIASSRQHFTNGATSILLEMGCGAGKSLIMRHLADATFIVFVFPSLALIAQFQTYLTAMPHIVVSSEASTDPTLIRSYLHSEAEQHVICVTYNSLDVVLDSLDGRVIDRAFFDEAHHVGSPEYGKIILGRTDLYKQQVHLTATPRDGVDYGIRAYHFPYSSALELKMVRRFRIRVCVRPRPIDGVTLKDYLMLLADSARKTGHTKALVFSSNVVSDDSTDITCVDAFTQPDLMREVLTEMEWGIPLEFDKIVSATSPIERQRLLGRFGMDDDVFRILTSCRTLSEGIDTCLADLALFADPKTTWWAIVQAIGRITRRNRRFEFDDDEATAVLPVFVDGDLYAACKTPEECDALLRETIGGFETLRNFLAALEQSDEVLADQIRNARWTPSELKENAVKQGWIVGEEMSLQDALKSALQTEGEFFN